MKWCELTILAGASSLSDVSNVIYSSRRFQPGEGPSRGLLRDCTTGCGTNGSFYSTKQDIALTLESPGEKYLQQDEMDLIKDLDDAMWDPKLQIPEEFRNLEPIWRKLNKVFVHGKNLKLKCI